MGLLSHAILNSDRKLTTNKELRWSKLWDSISSVITSTILNHVSPLVHCRMKSSEAKSRYSNTRHPDFRCSPEKVLSVPLSRPSYVSTPTALRRSFRWRFLLLAYWQSRVIWCHITSQRNSLFLISDSILVNCTVTSIYFSTCIS